MNKKFTFVLLLCVSFVILIFVTNFSQFKINYSTFYEQFVENLENRNSSSSLKNNSNVVILFWTKWFDKVYPSDEFFGNCLDRCTFIHDKKQFENSDALLFHARDIYPLDLPKRKFNEQIYIFDSRETPEMTFVPLLGVPIGFFDWIISYRRDSHVYCPYGYFESHLSNRTVEGKYV